MQGKMSLEDATLTVLSSDDYYSAP